MEQKIVCTLKKRKACNRRSPGQMGACGRCGWEQTEMQRRKAAIQTEGLTRDKRTGEYYLKVRKEQKDVGHDNG